jgi:hypothetical protein
MKAKEARRANLYVSIFEDNFSAFKEKYPAYNSDYFDEVVEKMIHCGDPKFGYVEYGCMYCGGHRHRVGMTCKCSLCLSCGRVKSEKFVYSVMNKLHDGVIYRHLILTMPDQLIPFFYKYRHSKDLFNEFYKVGFEYIQDVFQTVTKKKIKCGAIVVLHTTGRKGNYRPHLHIIVMNGGIDPISGDWINIGYFKYEKIMPRKWQWHLLNMIKEFDLSASTKKLVDKLWKKYKKGFYNHFKKGDVPSKSQHLVKYLSKYLFRPQIAVKRIKKYDNNRGEVTYEYVDHRTGKAELEVVSVLDFIGRMIQQVLPKGFQKIKYYGLHHTKTYEKNKEIVAEGMANINVLIFPNDNTTFKVAEDTYQSRLKLWTGKDPLECPHCGHQMEVIKIWNKENGVMFDLFEQLKKTGIVPLELEELQNSTISGPVNIIEEFYEQLDMAI